MCVCCCRSSANDWSQQKPQFVLLFPSRLSNVYEADASSSNIFSSYWTCLSLTSFHWLCTQTHCLSNLACILSHNSDINTYYIFVAIGISLTVKSFSLIMINNQAARLGDTRGQNHKSLTTQTRQKWDIICIRFIRLCEHMVLFSKCQSLWNCSHIPLPFLVINRCKHSLN